MKSSWLQLKSSGPRLLAQTWTSSSSRTVYILFSSKSQELDRSSNEDNHLINRKLQFQFQNQSKDLKKDEDFDQINLKIKSNLPNHAFDQQDSFYNQESQSTYRKNLTYEDFGSQHFKPSNNSIHESNESLTEYHSQDLICMLLIGLTAALVRFRNIGHPSSVVFDEVHFGKFVSHYLNREYFFDVHPPLAKLLLALQGWLIGFKGNFAFENIGDSYVDQAVPYVGLRAFSAILGSAIPVLIYAIMKESGYPSFIGLVSASLIVFDNAQILHSRLILLDAPLILFMTCSLFSYIKFYKMRYHEFTKPWWKWLILTGLSLSLTISCKFVGLFTFMSVGIAVAVDLWDILDIRRGHTLDHVGRHLVARIMSLVVFPFIIYLFWFWLHFAILTHSGTGDDFMSSAFQETLIGSPLTTASEEIRYNDTLLIQHRGTKCFLHSHLHRYPLKYDDGRVSSQGQQVTCYPHQDDVNNYWLVEPTKPIDDSGRGNIVRHHDVIRLKHIATNSYLFTHDVASPSMVTNQEFTTWPKDLIDNAKYNETGWKVVIDSSIEGKPWRTKSSHFKLIHETTGVAMSTTAYPPLPDWGFRQQEVNGHKRFEDRTLFWLASEIARDNTARQGPRPVLTPKAVQKRSFFKKYFELQLLMFYHNSDLTDSHPYASPPINWPFLLSGVSFWTSPPELKQQIFMIGNVAGWWFTMMCLSVIIGIIGADQFARRRGVSPIASPVRNRLYRNTGFFMASWACHYFPFYLMGRQRFLHHYLPAHVCSALVAGTVFNFVITETVNHPVSIVGLATRRKPRMKAEEPANAKYLTGIIIFLLIIVYNFIAPLTYGKPGLNPDQVNNRRILSSWTLHFAK
ncbi:hypothetical protein O181_053342 [Austropuccinia psidii MF-1]|uniref:Dolichyl-phosphate-mannose--protein mannosyltransferase n=1 Tax=Austropuccinia psidii MF-1 TaxID=1389203 RepID=A0A9Q3HRE7_9BASI|nr:hypothetical protein [Austropuccinia psidii MF-1]